MRDHLRNVKRTVSKHVVSIPSDTVVTAAQDDSALASVPSPSGKRLGVLREISEGASKKRFVEVWFGDRLEATKEVTKTHEGFHVNRTPVQVGLTFPALTMYIFSLQRCSFLSHFPSLRHPWSIQRKPKPPSRAKLHQ